MNGDPTDREELSRNLIIAAVTAPSAVIIFVVFFAVYTNITETAKAVGQVESSLTMGLSMGWIAMIGVSGTLAVLAIVSGVRAFRAWSRLRRSA